MGVSQSLRQRNCSRATLPARPLQNGFDNPRPCSTSSESLPVGARSVPTPGPSCTIADYVVGAAEGAPKHALPSRIGRWGPATMNANGNVPQWAKPLDDIDIC